MADIEAEAKDEAKRRWPSPNSGWYDGLHAGFVAGAMWAANDRTPNVVDVFKDAHGMGYSIERSPLGFRFVWQEAGEPDDNGEWLETRLAALCAAREDWAANGQGDDWSDWSRRLAKVCDE